MTVHYENEPALRDLTTRLSSDFSSLVRKEIELAKLEVQDKIRTGTKQVTKMGVGGVILLLGAMALTAALIALLSLAMAVWVSAFLVGAVLALIGLSLAMSAKKRMEKTDFVPRQSTQSIKRDTMVMKEALR
jgi:Flp pilus assembly protein TadB